MFTKEEIDKLQTGVWEIDCPEMILESNNLEDNNIYEGAGYIKHTEDGELLFKLYAKGKLDFGKILSAVDGNKAGIIVPKHKYFNLSATDTKDRNWKAGYIIQPIPEGVDGKEGQVVSGRILSELKHCIEQDCKSDYYQFSITIFGEFDIPYNVSTRTETKVANELQHWSMSLNKAKVKGDNYEIVFSVERNKLVVDVVAKSVDSCSNLEVKVVEAMQFVFARSINWSFLQKIEPNRRYVIIKPANIRENKRHSHPPITVNSVESRKFAWELFRKYLSYIIKNNNSDEWNPMSVYVYRVNDANLASIDTRSLAVPVAVEGVLNLLYSDVSPPQDSFLAQLNKAKESITSANLGENAKKRILDCLDNMKRISATDKLRFLVDKGVIDKGELNAWKKLRNYSAHPNQPNFPDLQKYIDLCHMNTMLFYKLVFNILGYEGKYTDYGSYNWPTKDFNGCYKKDIS